MIIWKAAAKKVKRQHRRKRAQGMCDRRTWPLHNAEGKPLPLPRTQYGQRTRA